MKSVRKQNLWGAAVCCTGMIWLHSLAAAVAQPMPGGMGFEERPEEPASVGFESAPDEVVKYVVDGASKRNQVVFISKAPKETFKGQTTKIAGVLTVNPHTLGGLSGNFEVAWDDISTGKPAMDEHMRDEPWVNARSHPKIVFNVTGFEPSETQPEEGKVIRGKLIGTFAMNGRENPVQIPAVLAYVKPGESKKGRKVREAFGIKASFSVNLTDYGIEGKVNGDQRAVGTSVAEQPKITVSVMLAREGDIASGGDGKATRGDKDKGKRKSKKKDDPKE